MNDYPEILLTCLFVGGLLAGSLMLLACVCINAFLETPENDLNDEGAKAQSPS